MRKVPLYIVRTTHSNGKGECRAIGHFDRMPTVAEMLEGLLLELENNEKYIEDFTARVGLIMARGVPSLPEFEADQPAAATFSYPDGVIRVERTYRFILDDQEAT